jgi:cytochrome b
LVCAVAAAWLSILHIGIPSGWHERAGYLAMACMGLRLVWGFVGSRHARFASFVHGPRATWRYARQVLCARAPRHVGHNPLGAWMVLTLLVCIAALTLTGWLQTTDRLWGSETLEVVHTRLAWSLAGLIGLHVAGVLITSLQHCDPLIRAMVTGRKAQSTSPRHNASPRP